MAKIIIMKGLPASGKSTRAKEIIENGGSTVRINKDLLRTMLHFDKFAGRNESLTRQASMTLARTYLSDGYNVSIDDTNLNQGTVDAWKALAAELKVKIEYQDMTNVPVAECVARDEVREKRVGAHVIQKMALQHLDYLSGQNVVICDLDGTLCDIVHRRHLVETVPKNWKAFFENIAGDTLREDVWGKVMDVCSGNGAKLIFVSARPETYREITEAWLKANLPQKYLKIYVAALIMREAHDNRPDTEVKAEIFDKFLKKLKIVRVFDDRPSVIQMWRSKGLQVEDVGDGKHF